MNVDRPRAPSGAPSGRASTMKISASTFEQKCLSPKSRHSSPSGTARVVFAPTSLPPWRSVRNIPPSHASSGSRLREPADELVAHRCRCVPLDDVGGARRHAEPAVDGGLGLAHEVRERGGEHRRDRAPGVRGQARESGPDEVRLALEPRRVVLDPVRPPRPTVVALQHRAVLVGDLGPRRQRTAAERAVAGDVLLGERPVLRLARGADRAAGAGWVGGVPVEADRLLVVRVVRQHDDEATRHLLPRLRCEGRRQGGWSRGGPGTCARGAAGACLVHGRVRVRRRSSVGPRVHEPRRRALLARRPPRDRARTCRPSTGPAPRGGRAHHRHRASRAPPPARPEPPKAWRPGSTNGSRRSTSSSWRPSSSRSRLRHGDQRTARRPSPSVPPACVACAGARLGIGITGCTSRPRHRSTRRTNDDVTLA